MDSRSGKQTGGSEEHSKRGLGITVLSAAENRIKYVFDTFPNIYLSFSAGKDSTVMLHLVMAEAIKRNKKIGVLLVDLEGQYKLTIDHALKCFEMYADYITPYWVSLPINLRNGVSQFEPQWCCWERGKEQTWIRNPPEMAIMDGNYFPFYRYKMEFEEFVPDFGHWYGGDKLTACFVGIRSDESLNRWRTIASHKKQTIDGHQWTTWCGGGLYNIYPIYDWKTKDIWIYQGKNQTLPYNKLYDRMYQAGLTIHQMRICQPYGDDQRKGLWLFQIIEPETWGRVVARVNGANQGALYAQEIGNILGVNTVTLPPNHTWQSFSMMLIDSMPPKHQEHYKDKIAVFLKWYQERGFMGGIPDDGPLDKSAPSWKRICKALLRNDYWCKGLSFSQHKSDAYEKYTKLMKRRRQQWKLMI
jgi:predicted phosphoadenosine phosphosulfate sulfurtransferase